MRRRLVRAAVVALVLPAGVKAMELAADRLEAAHGPTPSSKFLRRGSTIGRRISRRI